MSKISKTLIFLLVTSVSFEFIILNSLLFVASLKLVPNFEIGFLWLALFVGAAYLIHRYSDFGTRAWWVGFVVLVVGYLPLKWFGIKYDVADYMIAESEGRSISGGAAMGHLFLVVYLAGPAQLFSAAAFRLTKRFTRNKTAPKYA